MTIPTFIQNSRINQVIYQIRGDHLMISERSLVGRFKEYHVDLRSLDPDYHPRIARDYALLIIPLMTLLLCIGAIWGMMHQTLLPKEAVPGFYQWPVFAGLGSLIAAIRGSRRIEYYEFNNCWGKPALAIIRERPQADECATFITTLVAHIELAQADLSPDVRAQLLRRLELENPEARKAVEQVALWKISLVSGVLAAGLPWLPNSNNYFAGELFPVIFSLCVCGAAVSIFSFLANEPRRWWSAVGLVLSLIPPFFY